MSRNDIDTWPCGPGCSFTNAAAAEAVARGAAGVERAQRLRRKEPKAKQDLFVSPLPHPDRRVFGGDGPHRRAKLGGLEVRGSGRVGFGGSQDVVSPRDSRPVRVESVVPGATPAVEPSSTRRP
jgi:hypothetical protein